MRCLLGQISIVVVLVPVLVHNSALAAEANKEQLNTILVETKNSSTRSEADKLFNQADRIAQKLGSDKTDRSFLINRIKRDRATKYISLWQKDKANIQLLKDAGKILDNVIIEYGRLREYCEKRAESMEDRLSSSRLNSDPVYKQLRITITRTDYELGWSHYWRALSSDGQERADYFRKASGCFLKITANGYQDNHSFVADSFYGQALCLYHLRQFSRVVGEVLKADVVTPDNTPMKIFKQMTVIRLRCCREIDPWLANRFATTYFNRLRGDHGNDLKLDKTDLIIALEWVRSLAVITAYYKNEDDPVNLRSAQQDLNEKRRMIEAYGDPWKSQVARILDDKGLHTQLGSKIKATEYFNNKDYDKAVAEAENGLQSLPQNETDAKDLRSDLQYIRFASYWNQQRWLQAHTTAMEFLREHPQDVRASEVCVKAVQSGLKGLKASTPTDLTEFQNSITLLEEHFSDVPEVQQVRWRAARILKDKSPFMAQVLNEAVLETNPYYGAAQYDISNSLFREASQKVSISNLGQVLDKELIIKAADAFCRFVDSHTSSPRPKDEYPPLSDAVKLGSVIAMGLLSHDSPDYTRKALDVLDKISELQAGLTQTLQKALRFQAYILTGEFERSLECINGLVINDPQVMTIIHKIVIILEGRSAELIKQNAEVQTKNIDTILVTLYELLLEYIKTYPDQSIEQQKASLQLHLAHCLVHLGEFDKATKHYQWLVDNLSVSEAGSAIRGLAICHEAKKQYDLALGQWRSLYKQLELGTDEWLEATYHFIQCYIKIGDKENANTRFNSFRIDTEQMDIGQWGPKFEALYMELKTIP